MLLLLIVNLPYAQRRVYVNEFLYLGAGAKPMAQGNAWVARSSGPLAPYWNPAGLAPSSAPLALHLMYSSYFGNLVQYMVLGISRPLNVDEPDGAGIGVLLLRTAIDDIPYTLYLVKPDGSIDFSAISSFSEANYAFVVSYAQPLRTNNQKIKITAGGSLKIIHRRAGHFARAWGAGIDLGAQLSYGRWKFGAVIKDATTTVTFWSFNFDESEKQILQATGNEVYESSTEIAMPRLALGASGEFTPLYWVKIQPEIDFIITSDGYRNVLIPTRIVSIEPVAGLQIVLKDKFSLRAGIHTIQKFPVSKGKWIWVVTPTLGAGVKTRSLKIDYAVLNAGVAYRSLPSHVISIEFDLGKT